MREVALDGTIRTLAGGGSTTGDLNGVNALAASLQVGRVAVSRDGTTVYFSQPLSGNGEVVYALATASGKLLRIAGGGQGQPDRKAATAAALDQITALQMDPNDALHLVADQALLRLDADGTFTQLDAIPAQQIEVRPDGSRLSANGILWKRRPDGAYVIVAGSMFYGSPPVGGAFVPSALAGLPGSRVAFVDRTSRGTPAILVATPVDTDWTEPAPTLQVTAKPAGQNGTVEISVQVPPGAEPWQLKVRASTVRSPRDPTSASSAIEAPVDAAGGTKTVTISKLSEGYPANSYAAAPLKGGTTVHIAVFALSGRGEQAPVPVRASVIVTDNLVPVTLAAADPGAIAYGAGTTISAKLTVTATEAPMSGAPVVLKERRQGDGDWTKIATLTTDSDGKVFREVTPGFRTAYRWSYAGSDERKAADSDIVTVDVRPTMRAAALTQVKAGQSISFSGSADPANAPAPVAVQELIGGVWTPIANAPVETDGTFAATVPAPTPGTRTFRLVKEADNYYLGATSSPLSVTVYKAVIASIKYDPPGDDATNLNGESLVLRNLGPSPLVVTGWTLKATKSGRTFTLPSYTLPPGGSVRIHSGKGKTKAGHLYLGSTKPLWNNKSDSSTVKDRNGTTAATFKYRKA